MIEIDTSKNYILPESGAGGIDTGFVPSDRTVVKFIASNFSAITGYPVIGTSLFQFYINTWSGSTDPSSNFYGIKTFENVITANCSNLPAYRDNYFIIISTDVHYEITFGNGFLKVYDRDIDKIIIDETIENPSTGTESETLKIRPYISETSYISLYRLQIYDNDLLVRDYVPCHDDSNIKGLYDLVNKNIIYPSTGSWTGVTPYYRGTLIKTSDLAECYFNNNEVKTLKFNNIIVWEKQEEVVEYVTAVKSNAGAYCIIPYVPKNGTKTRFKSDGWLAEAMVYGCRYGGRNCEFNICATGTNDGKQFRIGLGGSYIRLSGTSSDAKDYTWTASSMSANNQYMYIFSVNTND